MFKPVKKRGLTSGEMALFPNGFITHLDMDRLRLINRTHNPFTSGKIVARGYDLYWKDYPADFTRQPLSERALLMHELCHVWQYKEGRLTAWSYLTRPKNWAYGYEFDPHKNFGDYAIEKQADLLQDWYNMNHGTVPHRRRQGSPVPSLAQINAVVPFKWDLTPKTVQEEDSLLIV